MNRALLLASSLCAATAIAHPLEDAAYEAAALCVRVDGVEALEQCMSTTSPSPHRAPARAALQRMFKARAAFMRECDTGHMLARCQEQAELYIWAGASRDFKWAVQYLDRPAR